VPLYPTFKDLHESHAFDLATLATDAGVPFAVIDMLLENTPIPKKEAGRILETVSRETGQDYGLHNVDVKLEEVQHE